MAGNKEIVEAAVDNDLALRFMENVVQLRPHLYEAKQFRAQTECGEFTVSGTLCGHIDFAGPWGTYVLSPDEAHAIIVMLQQARADVLENSDPLGDPRIIAAKQLAE